MSGSVGLKPVRDGLVLVLDASNTKSISQPPKTNFLLWSQDFSKSSWNKGGATVTSTQSLAPDGTNTACIIDDTNASLTSSVPIQQFTARATTLNVSIYTKDINSGSRVFLVRNITTATNFNTVTFTYSSTGNIATGWFSQDYGNGWYRLSYTKPSGFTVSVGDTLSFYYGRSGAAAVGSTASWLVWGAQAEVGTLTDYILSTSTQGVRNTLYDLSKSGLNSALYNFPGLSNSNNLTFDGISQYGNLLNQLTLSNDFTISIILKINTTDVTLEGRDTIISDASPTASIYNLELATKSLVINNMGAYIKNVYPVTSLTSSNIYHLVVTRNQSNLINVFVNNTQVDSNLNLNKQPGNFNVGSFFQVLNTRFFNGNFYSAYIYNRILSANELSQNYNTIKKKYNLISVTASDLAQATLDMLKVRAYSEAATVENEAGTLTILQNLNNYNLLGSASFVLTPTAYNEGIVYPAKPYINNYNLLYSTEDFSSTVWARSSFTCSINGATAPDGTITMDKIIIATGIDGSSIGAGPLQTISKLGISKQYTYSIYAQPAGFNGIYIFINGIDVNSSANYAVRVDNGTAIYGPITIGSFSNASGAIENVGNGIYRVSLTFNTDTDVTLKVRQWVFNNIITNDVGDGVNGIYLWGAQLVEGPDKLAYQKVAATQQLVTFTRGSISTRIDPNSYLGSVPYNLLSGSLYLNTNWNILNSPGVTVSYNAGVAPDGNYTATRIQFSGTNKGYYQYPNSVAMAVDLPTTGSTFSLSVYVKGNSGESISLAMGGSNPQTVFTMSGYWQRLVYGATAFDNTAGLSINTYNSVTSRDLLVWGAQFVKGGDSLPYLGVTNRLNVPCIDYTTGIGTIRASVAAENYFIYSQDLTNSAWIKTGVSVSTSPDIDPSGVYGANRLITNQNMSILTQNPPGGIGNRVPLVSAYIKRVSGTGNVWLQTGPIIATASISATWSRYSVDGVRISCTYSSTTGFYTINCVAPHGLTSGDAFKLNTTTTYNGFNATVSTVLDDYSFTSNYLAATIAATSGNTFAINGKIKIENSGDQIDIWGVQISGTNYVGIDTYTRVSSYDYNKDYVATRTTFSTRSNETLSINQMYNNGLVSGTFGCILFDIAIAHSLNGFYTSGEQFYIKNTLGQNFIDLLLNQNNSIRFRWVANANAIMFSDYAMTLRQFNKFLIRYTSSTVELFANGSKFGSTYTITVARDTTLDSIVTVNPYLLIKSISYFPFYLSDTQCQNLTL